MDFENAVFPDGILVYVQVDGLTSLLPRDFGPLLNFLSQVPKGTTWPMEKLISDEMSIEGVSIEEIRQAMVDVGVVSVC